MLNPEHGRIHPIDDLILRPPHTHHDDIVGAAALGDPADTGPLSGDNVETNTTQTRDEDGQGLFPPKSAGGKASRELQRLSTTNHPGYSETLINPNAVERENWD